MIVAIGIDVDDTFVRFVQQSVSAGADLRAINLRVAVEGEWYFDVPPKGQAFLRYDGEVIRLDPDDSYFCRLIDLSSQLSDVNLTRRWQALAGGLRAWLDAVPARVANRLNAGAHNSSKPLHESILRDLGFRVPESVTSSEADELRRFVREGPAISKAVCGVRADTITVTEADFDGFDPASGPVHLQRLVTGADARIHVVGEAMVAQRVSVDGVDYRRAGGLSDMEVFELPDAMRELLVEGTKRVGLAFAGWDFKIDDEGAYWCFEVTRCRGTDPTTQAAAEQSRVN